MRLRWVAVTTRQSPILPQFTSAHLSQLSHLNFASITFVCPFKIFHRGGNVISVSATEMFQKYFCPKVEINSLYY